MLLFTVAVLNHIKEYSLIRCINKACKDMAYISIIGNSLVCQHECSFQLLNSSSTASNKSHTQKVRLYIDMYFIPCIFKWVFMYYLNYLWKNDYM